MQIANADQGVDDNPATSPGFGGTPQQQQVNTEYHNLGPQVVMGIPDPTYLEQQWNAATFEPQYEISGFHFKPIGTVRHCDLDKLGIYLHHLQDTFAHDGFTNPVIGHGLAGHTPDHTAADWQKAAKMAGATWSALLKYTSLCKCACYNEKIAGREDQLFKDGQQLEKFLQAPGGSFGSGISEEELRNKLNILGLQHR